MYDIFEFLNSKDVKGFLQEKGYELSTLQKVFVIYKSNHQSLKNKKQAWEELINSSENIVLGEDGDKRWFHTDVYLNSVHDLISR